jgi:hypothetical protein
MMSPSPSIAGVSPGDWLAMACTRPDGGFICISLDRDRPSHAHPIRECRLPAHAFDPSTAVHVGVRVQNLQRAAAAWLQSCTDDDDDDDTRVAKVMPARARSLRHL